MKAILENSALVDLNENKIIITDICIDKISIISIVKRYINKIRFYFLMFI